MWKCSICNKRVKTPSAKCPHGRHKTGLPTNIVRAGKDEPALLNRYAEAARLSKDAADKLKKYKELISKNLTVSINIQPESLLNLLSSDRVNYLNLHDNLRAGAVSGVDEELVAKRTAVDNWVFGIDGARLRFGALNFDTIGLYSYGAVCVFLKPGDIKDRVSFLEENSFNYQDPAKGVRTPPAGSRALWRNAPALAVVKHRDEILTRPRLTRAELGGLLISCDGSKKSDSFIEAQILPPITRGSISEIIYAPSRFKPIKAKGIVKRTAEHNRRLAQDIAGSLGNTLMNYVRHYLGGVKFRVVD